MDLNSVSVHNYRLAKKGTEPISSHLDRTSLVNKGFIIWLSGKFFLRVTAGSPERVREWHPARSGSQSQRRIWFILPAHGASHIIIQVRALDRSFTANTLGTLISLFGLVTKAHFRVALSLSIKTRQICTITLMKMSLFARERNSFTYERMGANEESLWERGLKKSEMAYQATWPFPIVVGNVESSYKNQILGTRHYSMTHHTFIQLSTAVLPSFLTN